MPCLWICLSPYGSFRVLGDTEWSSLPNAVIQDFFSSCRLWWFWPLEPRSSPSAGVAQSWDGSIERPGGLCLRLLMCYHVLESASQTPCCKAPKGVVVKQPPQRPAQPSSWVCSIQICQSFKRGLPSSNLPSSSLWAVPIMPSLTVVHSSHSSIAWINTTIHFHLSFTRAMKPSGLMRLVQRPKLFFILMIPSAFLSFNSLHNPAALSVKRTTTLGLGAAPISPPFQEDHCCNSTAQLCIIMNNSHPDIQ